MLPWPQSSDSHRGNRITLPLPCFLTAIFCSSRCAAGSQSSHISAVKARNLDSSSDNLRFTHYVPDNQFVSANFTSDRSYF